MNSCLRSLVVILLAVQCCRSQIAYCKESVASVTFVASCPNSKEEWDRAARKKNCNEMATQQTCAPAENFKYHCVINGYRNALLEVCAPERLILGHCTEFNVIGGIIQDHQSAPCNNGSFPKCDRLYSSSDAYKYPHCYHLVRPTTAPPTIAPPTTAPKEKPTTDKMTFIIAVIVAIVFTFFTITIVCWKVYFKKKLVSLRVKYRRGKPCNNQQRDSGEIAITRSSCSGLSLDQLQSSAKRGSADFHADKDASNLANRDDCELRSTDSNQV